MDNPIYWNQAVVHGPRDVSYRLDTNCSTVSILQFRDILRFLENPTAGNRLLYMRVSMGYL